MNFYKEVNGHDLEVHVCMLDDDNPLEIQVWCNTCDDAGVFERISLVMMPLDDAIEMADRSATRHAMVD